jgi:4-hydroxybenzoate polyprenyltransferase
VNDSDDSVPPLTDTTYERPARSPLAPWLPILRLMRLPNVFTAVADVMMGFVFARHSFSPGGALACLVLASGLLYTAGMILNDVFDLEIDKAERPNRPLPSGQIGVAQARAMGFLMLLFGVGFGWMAGYLYQKDALPPILYPWRSGAVASILAVAVLLYDAVLKKTPLGPLSMGLCRSLNALLGMSLAGPPGAGDAGSYLGYTYAQWIIAAGFGLYVAGITFYAKSEAEQSSSLPLFFGIAIMVAGVIVLGVAANFTTLVVQQNLIYWALLGLLTATIVRRAISAALDGSPALVQGAVKHAILSIIMLDAAVCLAAGESPVYGVVVVALLGPAVLLGKWVYST